MKTHLYSRVSTAHPGLNRKHSPQPQVGASQEQQQQSTPSSCRRGRPRQPPHSPARTIPSLQRAATLSDCQRPYAGRGLAHTADVADEA